MAEANNAAWALRATSGRLGNNYVVSNHKRASALLPVLSFLLRRKMAQNIATRKPTWDDRADRKSITIWDRWQPACDSCGRLESSLKERLISCSNCLVAKYCSDKCREHDWSDGSHHKERCHLFEVDRKLSDVHFHKNRSEADIKCFSPGLNDTTLSLPEQVSKWTGLHHYSVELILYAAFKNNEELKKKMHLGIFLKLVGKGPRYDRYSFIIDKVALMPLGADEGWTSVKMGFCWLPGGKMSSHRDALQFLHSETTLPPEFNLHRLITQINRGITHFHEAPPEWLHYMRNHTNGFCYVEGILPEVFGVEKRDGTRVPLYKYDQARQAARAGYDLES
ncbi:hypothetical protein DFH09DRAFT_1366131 [Mycena vulgaris]|nr:hypothetical protein DFH09DRAFT_1366131 [Mycena vulgaris]